MGKVGKVQIDVAEKITYPSTLSDQILDSVCPFNLYFFPTFQLQSRISNIPHTVGRVKLKDSAIFHCLISRFFLFRIPLTFQLTAPIKKILGRLKLYGAKSHSQRIRYIPYIKVFLSKKIRKYPAKLSDMVSKCSKRPVDVTSIGIFEQNRTDTPKVSVCLRILKI